MALATRTTNPASMDMVVSELMSQGRESTAILEALLHDASSPAPGGLQELAAEILRCCDRALAALRSGGEDAIVTGSASAGRKRKSAPTSQTTPKRRARASGGDMPTRVEKKTTVDDGFIWRKYGQKDIHNSKYPRLYFSCTYKHDSGCRARRQVQQSEDDPSLYVIAYFGEHTCHGIADDAKVQPFVINFGSATATSASPWPSSSDDDDVRTDSSSSSQAVSSPEEDGGKLHVKVTKVESDSHPAMPAAEMSSSTDDVSCASPALDPLLGYLDDWDRFGDSSFDISEYINFDEIALLQYHA